MHKHLTATVAALTVFGFANSTSAAQFSTSSNSIAANGDTAFSFNVIGLTPPTQNVTLALNFTQPNFFNLEAVLQAPTGQVLTVFQSPSASGTFNGTLSDLGATNVDSIFGAGSFTGTFAPSGQSTISGSLPASTIFDFSGFNGVDPNGTWTLTFNNAGGSGGSLTGASTILDITPVPFEFSPAIGIASLAGMYAFRKLRRQQKVKK